MAEMICPYCKIEFPSDYKWCMEDGSELEQNMGQYDENTEGGTKVPCPDCGEPVDTRDIYCGSCASKIEGRLPQPEPQDDYYDDEETVEEYQDTAEDEYNEEPHGPTRPCPRCGDAVGLADTFCGGCGAQLESAIPASSFDGTIQGRACPHCAGGLEPEDTYCGSCGHSVEPEVESAPAAICGSCGMEIAADDTFCGTCGSPVQHEQENEAPDQESYEAPSRGFQQDQNYDTVATGSCPNCGMDISPEDTFCGTCGASTSATQDSSPEPAASFNGDESSETTSSSGSCPNCGMEISTEDTFCGTCGASTSATQDSSPEPENEYDNSDESYDNMSVPVNSSPASISDFTKDIPVCPSCGIQGEPGQTSCYTCCVEMTTEDTLAPGAPSSFNADDSYQAENTDSDGIMVPDMGSSSGDEKICSCCGVSSPPETEFCGNCGIDF